MVEYGTAEQIFERPKMPYTMGLLESLPRLDQAGVAARFRSRASRRICCGCRPAARSHRAAVTAMPICDEPVPLYDFGDGHVARCYLYDERTEGQKTLPAENAPVVAELGRRRIGATGGHDVSAAPQPDGHTAAAATGDDLVVVRDLTKYFPINAGIFQRHVADVQRGRRNRLRDPSRRDARSRRRVRFGQDDGGTRHPAADRCDQRQRHVRGARARRPDSRASCARCAKRCRSSSRIRTRR